MVIEIYTEYTPNPDSLKFVSNRMLYPNNSIDFGEPEGLERSPLAKELFDKPYVQGVFIANNFVTITRAPGVGWEGIIPEVKELLKKFINDERTAVDTEAVLSAQKQAVEEGEVGSEIELKIRQLLDTYVKPAVEMDGGAIVFKSFDEGKLTLIMQGSCSGCPSSTVTLKNGIEGLMNRMVPEVKEVVAIDG